MAYFTAVVARSGSSWRSRDVQVDDAPTLEDLADALRGVALADQPVLAVIEHEDEWFALVRVDGDDEPRLFVSDLDAAAHSRYGPLLAPAEDVEDGDDLDADDGAGQVVAQSGDDAPGGETPSHVAPWVGDTELLEDLGVSGRTLRKLVEENDDDPGAVLAEVGETVGFTELLDTLR